MNETIQKLLKDFETDIKNMNIHTAAAGAAHEQYRQLARKAEQEDTCDYDDAITEAATIRNRHQNEATRSEIFISSRVEKIIRGPELAEFWKLAGTM